jgi:hypothetical protein
VCEDRIFEIVAIPEYVGHKVTLYWKALVKKVSTHLKVFYILCLILSLGLDLSPPNLNI